jgi:flagellar basal body-associated protein FliL
MRVEEGETQQPARGGSGIAVGLLLLVLVAIAGVLFAASFWRTNGEGGDPPQVRLEDGELPTLDLESGPPTVSTKKPSEGLAARLHERDGE